MAKKENNKSNPFILCDEVSPKKKVIRDKCDLKTKCNFTKLKIIKNKESSSGSMDSNSLQHNKNHLLTPDAAGVKCNTSDSNQHRGDINIEQYTPSNFDFSGQLPRCLRTQDNNSLTQEPHIKTTINCIETSFNEIA